MLAPLKIVLARLFPVAFLVLSVLLFAWYYRWHDTHGDRLSGVPRCLPWQTVEDHCVEFDIPCGKGFPVGSKCDHGMLFGSGEE